MSLDRFDGEIEGQMSLEDMFEPPERLVAVSRIFARARKNMSLAEQKCFVYALSEIKFREEAKANVVYLDKKTLAKIVGVESDSNHLSENLYRAIKDLPAHSFIQIADRDLGLYDSGMFVTRVTMLKNRVRVKFEDEYLGLFTGLSRDYITLWSSDIFSMASVRSVQFYEYLRQATDTRRQVNDVGLGIKAIKEMFGIPESGKGSYMRGKGGFNRWEFEKKVIEPLCEDLAKCKMINLLVQPDGKYFEKVKRGSRVQGYKFYWTISEHPAVATAAETKEIQERVDANPEVLKVAKDIVKGEKKPKGKSYNRFNDFPQRKYKKGELDKFISNH